jgi:hypothetical protein
MVQCILIMYQNKLAIHSSSTPAAGYLLWVVEPDADQSWPFRLTLSRWSGTLFIFVYCYSKFKILYFDINSTLLWIRKIVFHCLAHVMRCSMWKFPIPGYAKKSEFWHLRAVINFSLGPDNWTRLRESAKKPGQRLVILPTNENNAKAIMT